METDHSVFLQQIINGEDISVNPACLMQYFIESEEFQNTDYYIFIFFFLKTLEKELLLSPIINQMEEETFENIDIENSLLFFQKSIEMSKNPQLGVLFANWLTKQIFNEEHLNEIFGIVSVIEFNEEIGISILDYIITNFRSVNDLENKKCCLEIICDVLRGFHKIIDFDFTELFNIIYEMEMQEEISLRQLILTKNKIFNEKTLESCKKIIENDISNFNEIPEYEEIISENICYWNSESTLLNYLLILLLSLVGNDEAIMQLQNLTCILLSKLDCNDDIWVAGVYEISNFFISNMISIKVFSDFVNILRGLSEQTKMIYIENDGLNQKSNEFNCKKIRSFFNN